MNEDDPKALLAADLRRLGVTVLGVAAAAAVFSKRTRHRAIAIAMLGALFWRLGLRAGGTDLRTFVERLVHPQGGRIIEGELVQRTPAPASTPQYPAQ